MPSCIFSVAHDPTTTLSTRPDTFEFSAKLDIAGQGVGGVRVEVDNQDDKKKAPRISIKFDKALLKRSGLRLTMSLTAAPANACGDAFPVTILDKNHSYNRSSSQVVEIGGEAGLEWNYCGSVRTETYCMSNTTFEMYSGKTKIFKINMRDADNTNEVAESRV